MKKLVAANENARSSRSSDQRDRREQRQVKTPASTSVYRMLSKPKAVTNGASRTAQNDNGHHYGNVKGGWWVQAGDLEVGQRLLTSTGGIAEVISVEIEDTAFDAYNLTVADFHTYFVRSGDGKLGGAPPSPDHAANDNAPAVWVHNSDCWGNLTELTKSQLKSMLSPSDTRALNDLFGKNVADGLQYRNGKPVVPKGLTRNALHVYRELAVRAIAKSEPKQSPVQNSRIKIIDELLK